MSVSINALSRRQLFQGAITLVGTLAGSRLGHAIVRPGTDASSVVSRLVEHILQVIGSDQGGTAQERRLMAAIESQTDLSLLARMTLGRHWRTASVEQRRDFVDVFRRYLLQTFTARLKSYAGTDMGPPRDHFTIVGTRSVGKKDVIVRSRIKPPSGAPLEVDWRLRARGDRLFVIDLVVEGVSLLITQRSEFGSVVERIGLDGLIGELQTRVSEGV